MIIKGDNKLLIITESKTFHFDLPKDVGINLKNSNYSIIKHNEILVEYTIQNQIRQLLSKYKHRTYIHEYGKQ